MKYIFVISNQTLFLLNLNTYVMCVRLCMNTHVNGADKYDLGGRVL